MIEKEFNTKLSLSSVDNYLKTKQIKFDNRMFSDEEITIKQWIDYRFPTAISDAKENNATICWTDAFCKQKIQYNIYLTKLIILPNNKFMFNLSRNDNSVDSLIDYLAILITQFDKMIFLIVDFFVFEQLDFNEKIRIETFLQKNSKKIKFLL